MPKSSIANRTPITRSALRRRSAVSGSENRALSVTSRQRSAGSMPGPLSRTSTRRAPDCACRATRIWPRPGSQNFAALDSRFSITWMMRSTSARTGGTFCGSWTSTLIACSSKTWLMPVTASPISSRISTRDSCHSALPDSIFERSNTWLISRVRRSVSLVMMPRNFERCSASTLGCSSRICVKARIEVSGVRSSWLTVETKSSFIRSSSFSCSFAARSSAVAASSSCDFCSSRWL